MLDRVRAEIRIAVAEGVLASEEVDALQREAESLERSPLDLLRERGRLTDETHVSLCARAAGAPEEDALDAVFPVPDWDRYEPIRWLGEGGMGRVFLARDSRLGREVALKFVRDDDPELSKRIVAEARAQARVDHPRVCKVYEVGEIRGKVYIAMQYVDGRPLSELGDEVSFEQKATLVHGAALGLEGAHRAGLIHRDVKPSNILVARTKDGTLEPFVVDFGLARSTEGGATTTHAAVGTPHYMAPEQARGEVSTLDRRADVYGLGATLYALLTGKPPIPGDNLLEVLSRIATFEPLPPRALRPDIPEDLEAITLKCLEKDRSARYESALALAMDLDRFLRGEPVLARPGLGYRLRKKLRKHARAAVLVAAALVLVVITLSYVAAERARARERERLARHFTESAEQIESEARLLAMSRLHDIRSDKQKLKDDLDTVAREVEQAGAIALEPGQYALGVGFLALGDADKARSYLEAAWDRGYGEPRVAYSLALVMARLYQRALLDAERIGDDATRMARKNEIARLYRDRALTYLRKSAGAPVPSAAYVVALIAYCEERFDDALASGDRIEKLSWFYERQKLRGDILLARARARWRAGQVDRSRSDFQEGREAYAAAAATAESATEVHVAMAELEYAELAFEIYGGGAVAGPFSRGVAATDRALTVDPDHYESLVLRAQLRRSMAEHHINHSSPARDLLALAVADAERAAQIDPRRKDAWLELARVRRQWGDEQIGRSEDPRAELEKAFTAVESIAPEERDHEVHATLGLIHQAWADADDQNGRDAGDHRSKAIDAYAAALRANDRAAAVWLNLGVNYFTRASQPKAADPDKDLEQAFQALAKGRELAPKHVVAYFYEGEVHLMLASRKKSRGADPEPDLSAALASYRAGLEVDPKLPQLHNGIGTVFMERAALSLERGERPDALLAEAQAAFEKATVVAPDQAYGYHNLAEALSMLARAQRARGDDPTNAARAALLNVEKAIDRLPDFAQAWANRGMIQVLLSRFELGRGRDPGPAIEKAKVALEKALSLDPGLAVAHVYLGEMRGLLASWRVGRARGDPRDFEAAAEAFRRGLELAPDERDHQALFSEFCRAWGAFLKKSGRDPSPSLACGATRSAPSRP